MCVDGVCGVLLVVWLVVVGMAEWMDRTDKGESKGAVPIYLSRPDTHHRSPQQIKTHVTHQPSNPLVMSSRLFFPSLTKTATSRCRAPWSVFLKVSKATPMPVRFVWVGGWMGILVCRPARLMDGCVCAIDRVQIVRVSPSSRHKGIKKRAD